MGNVLSQDEVDSLLGGINDGKVKTETNTPETGKGLEIYDFTSKARPSQDSMSFLGVINERFVDFLRASLTAATGSIVEATTSSAEPVEFDEFCHSIKPSASMNVFKMGPLKGSALLVLEGSLVFAFVDTFFGGEGASQAELEEREFTAIEGRIIQKVVTIILRDLEQAWAGVQKLKMSLTSSEIDSQVTTVAKPNDLVLVNRFIIELGNTSGSMTLCVPYGTIEPISSKLRRGLGNEEVEIDQTWRKHFAEKIRELTVGLRCTLGTAKITGRELLGLKVDDVIALDKGVGDVITVSVEDVPKFKGFPGVFNNKQAIRISGRLSKE
jgi:flagellar motor switch protein FliM